MSQSLIQWIKSFVREKPSGPIVSFVCHSFGIGVAPWRVSPHEGHHRGCDQQDASRGRVVGERLEGTHGLLHRPVSLHAHATPAESLSPSDRRPRTGPAR